MDLQKEREAFEAWLFREYPNAKDFVIVYRPGENIYEHRPTQVRWEAWQAAKAQAVPEWFDYTKQSPQMDGNYQIFIKGEQITAKWVSRFGFADPIEGDALRQELITHWAMQPQSPKAQEPAND